MSHRKTIMSNAPARRKSLESLLERLQDSSRAVGRSASRATTSSTVHARALLNEKQARSALVEYLQHPLDSTDLVSEDSAARDFYASLHGDNGLYWQIRAQQALGRGEVPSDVSGDSWIIWGMIRAGAETVPLGANSEAAS